MATNSRRPGLNEDAGYSPEYVPIARLLAMAYRSLIDDLHEKLAESGVHDMRPSYAFVLLAARESPILVGDVGDLLGITKQAASKLIDSLESDGYVRRVLHATDARSRHIAVTKKGHRVLGIVEHIYRELEHQWASIVTRRQLEAMRRDLTHIVRAQHKGKLPPVRPTF
jgi:DNA-binding MarR family transcriptional regulator